MIGRFPRCGDLGQGVVPPTLQEQQPSLRQVVEAQEERADAVLGVAQFAGIRLLGLVLTVEFDQAVSPDQVRSSWPSTSAARARCRYATARAVDPPPRRNVRPSA